MASIHARPRSVEAMSRMILRKPQAARVCRNGRQSARACCRLNHGHEVFVRLALTLSVIYGNSLVRTSPK
jgi:hypothetical protein